MRFEIELLRENLLLNVQPWTCFLALDCCDSDSSVRIVIDHSVILIPENIFWGKESILKDADQWNERAFFYSVFVCGKNDGLRSHNFKIYASGLDLPIWHCHLKQFFWEVLGKGKYKMTFQRHISSYCRKVKANMLDVKIL